ncbi:MAG TPA: class I SAM-dependent methyltransferase [Candidatus Methanoperedens sp.]|nr:class I SAM-dependent methyltransferase [Candidatus Methanoperedens sp.]
MRETADVETSSEGYAARFAGPVGAWMLGVQERSVRQLLESLPAGPILDVGGGHGQLALPLAATGREVTVLGSNAACARRLAPGIAAGRVRFLAGDVLDLPIADRSFDVVLCFRLLPHCDAWERLVAELCRVARVAVIADYPTSESLNRIAPALFGAKKRLEGNTRTFTLFTHREIQAAFAASGFARSGRAGEFFLPMVLHRALGCRPCSATLEGICRALGLSGRWGSPVVARFERARDGNAASAGVARSGGPPAGGPQGEKM